MKKDELENLRKASPEEVMLRFKRASLVLLLKEVKELGARYQKATGKTPPSVLKLVKENL